MTGPTGADASAVFLKALSEVPLSVAAALKSSEVTKLPKGTEGVFKRWVKRYNVQDLDADKSFYDYRGAFLNGDKPDKDGHWPDTWKQHGHPTFSVESKYSSGPTDGGRWVGEVFVPQPKK